MKKRLFSVILTAIMCVVLPLSINAKADTPPTGDVPWQGVDVYEGDSDNGQINWGIVAQSKSFAWIKISEGEGYEDSMWQSNIEGAQASGIAWGPYQFLRLYSPESCVRQADNFWSRIQGTGYNIIPAVDVESYDNCDTSDEVRACVRAFVDEFRALVGYNPIIYTYTAYAEDNDLADAFPDCLLWQADYRGYTGDTGFTGWSAWQYSETGDVDGIQNHYVDLDEAANDIFTASPAASRSVPAPVPSDSGDYPGFYAASQLDGPINCRAGADFDVLDQDGNAVPGHEVSNGDPLVLLGVDYGSQLAEVEYPVSDGWMHGYIHNREDLLHNTGYNAWRNGSTPETVYDADGNIIGSIDPGESADVLQRCDDGRTQVLYSTVKGPETKSGYVWFGGLQ